jgi:hypothetical protein
MRLQDKIKATLTMKSHSFTGQKEPCLKFAFREVLRCLDSIREGRGSPYDSIFWVVFQKTDPSGAVTGAIGKEVVDLGFSLDLSYWSF